MMFTWRCTKDIRARLARKDRPVARMQPQRRRLTIGSRSSLRSYELYAGVVEDADAGGGEVGADEQLVAAEIGAEVRQRGWEPRCSLMMSGMLSPLENLPVGMCVGKSIP